MAITLPQKPDGAQYEDLVTASLKALGYFTETRLILRETRREVLELDVVATSTGDAFPSRKLFEAKKEGFNFPTIFKLFGQRQYLDIPSACLVSQAGCPDAAQKPIYEAKASEMDVALCHHSLVSPAEDLAEPCNNLNQKLRQLATQIVWYQQIAKRIASDTFIHDCKTNGGSSIHDMAKDYYYAVIDSFFEPKALARAEMLYEAFWRSPRLPGQFVKSLAGKRGVSEQDVWGKLNDLKNFLPIQSLMLLEHSARISVVKNALEYVVKYGKAKAKTRKVKIGSVELDWPEHILPASFWKGVEALFEHPYKLHIPYLFQVFVEVFGGFLFYKDPEELELLSDFTGIPAGDVLEALHMLDHFFAPSDGTWFYVQKDQLLCMKMIPAFVHGGGCFLRYALYELKAYEDKFPDMAWLLRRWHNVTYSVLERELKKA